MILYPELANDISTATPMSELVTKMKNLTGMSDVSEPVKDLLKKIQVIEGNKTIKILEQAFSSFTKSEEAVVVTVTAKRILEEILEKYGEETDFTLEAVLREEDNKYIIDCGNKSINKGTNQTYELVQKKFEEDIYALQIMLQRAFVPAVNLDKAFSAKETKLIEDMIFSLEEEKFLDFIAENVNIIKASEVDKIKEKDAEKKLDIAVKKEIRKILDGISDTE